MERQKLINGLNNLLWENEEYILYPEHEKMPEPRMWISPKEARLFLELLEKEEENKTYISQLECQVSEEIARRILDGNTPDLQPLFNYLSEEHGLNLLENELHEIVRLVNN